MRSFFDMLVIVPMAGIIVTAIALAGASMVESTRMAQTTSQILNLVAAAQVFSAREAKFATQPGEDLIAALNHAGMIARAPEEGQPTHLNNAWGGAIRAVAAAPSDMRLEADVPPRACRRLALFLASRAAGLGVRVMESREGADGAWRRFFEGGEPSNVDETVVQAACGTSTGASLAVVFKLRG